MKKLLLVGSIVLVLGLLIVGSATTIMAHGPGDGEATTASGVYLDQPTLTRLAQVLGLTQDELAIHLQDGKTLSEIAVEQNVPEEEVVKAILAPLRDTLQLRVNYGYITQEQADALLEKAEDHARTLLDQNLSSSSGQYGSYTGEEMEDYCSDMMGNGQGGMMGNGWGGMTGNGFGGMMGNGWGGMMGGGFGGMTGNRWGGMTGHGSGGRIGNGWGGTISRGLGNMMAGWWNIFR